MRNSKEYLKRLANKIILETLEDKANEVMEKIKSNSFDYVGEGNVCECGSREFYERECVECGGGMKGDFMEGNVCECGGDMREGMCMECGKMKDEILEYDSNQYGIGGMELKEKWKGNVKVKKTGEHAGKSISDIDSRIKALKDLSQSYQDKGERVPKKLKEKMSELYFAKKSKKGWPGKGKVDVDEEVEEGNLFSGERDKAIKAGKSSFNVDGKTYPVKETLYRLVDGDESALFTENEVIDIIENIVNEEKKKEKDNIKKGVTPKGLGKYEKVHKDSGKENEDYLKSVAKKMIDYIKDGSKGKYETNPKHFPKGNGQLAKMDKKAYEIDEEGTDFNMEIGGQNIPDYDGKPPKKETIEKQIKGSSDNGNNQEWANADNTGVNDKFAEYFESDQLAKWKDESYGRVPSPVYDEKPKKRKKRKTVKEEFERISELMNYSKKTQ